MKKDVTNRTIVVVGAARSGVAVSILLKKYSANVFLTDNGKIPDHFVHEIEQAGVDFEQGGHSEKAFIGEFLVVSPGVPDEAELVQYYLKNGKEVYSEIEVASWFTDSRLIAITGSNGKTTTTSWVADMWKREGKSYFVGGNIGSAFAGLVTKDGDNSDMLLEVSSFQLDHIKTFKPFVSAILNITPDHLNRYQNSFEKYTSSKMRIMENQDDNDFFIYNYDDPVLKEKIAGAGIRPDGPIMLPFSMLDEVSRGAFVRNGTIYLNLNGEEEEIMPVEQLRLKGPHNLSNGLAAAITARVAEISKKAIRESLSGFEGVEHRLELVRVHNGVRYINDSKATNVNAVWFALQSYQSPMVLILGGRDKGNNYAELIPQIREKVHTIIAIGEGKKAIHDQLESVVPYLLDAASMEQAVLIAEKKAQKGEVVLLSPACASFDMFDGFEHRGQVFKNIVNQL